MQEPNYIKTNIPSNEEDYRQGNGEGCFFLVDDKTMAAYEKDEEKSGKAYFGILDSVPFSYGGLQPGMRLPLEMRGENRPVVPLSYLREHFAA